MLNQSNFTTILERTERKLELDTKVLRCIHGKRPARTMLPVITILAQLAHLCSTQLEKHSPNYEHGLS